MDLKLLWDIFFLFMKVALFSWGGGPASMGLMQRETLSAGWVTTDEFADALAVSNALPGPVAPQVSAYVGYKLAGIWGAVSAVTGTVLPATILMLVMIHFFFQMKDLPAVKSMLTAVRPVVVGLLLWTTYEMARTVFKFDTLGLEKAFFQGWDKLAFVVVSFAVFTFTNISPVFIIIGAALLGFIVYR